MLPFLLFSKDFDKRAKEHVESISALKKLLLSSGYDQSFQRNYPSTSQGGEQQAAQEGNSHKEINTYITVYPYSVLNFTSQPIQRSSEAIDHHSVNSAKGCKGLLREQR